MLPAHAQDPAWEQHVDHELQLVKYRADSFAFQGSHENAVYLLRPLLEQAKLSFSEYFTLKLSAKAAGRPITAEEELSFYSRRGIVPDTTEYSLDQLNLYRAQLMKHFPDQDLEHAWRALFLKDQLPRRAEPIPALKPIDQANWAEAKTLIQEKGFPGSDNGWLALQTVLQHAIREDLVTRHEMEWILPHLFQHVQDGFESIDTYCMFYDLMLVHIEKKPQRFGTLRQYDNKTLHPHIGRERMNAERRKVGAYLSVEEQVERYGHVVPE